MWPGLRMTIRPPSPLRWSVDAWGAIAVVSTATVFALGLLLCLLSFAFPPLSILLLGIVGSVLVGLAISVAVAFVLWVALTPIYWLAHWLVWKLMSGTVGLSPRDH